MFLKRLQPKAAASALLIALSMLSAAAPASAQEGAGYSPTLFGPLGLNTVPSARMDKAGTLRIGVGSTDPYVHGFLGFQLADALHVNMRQSAEISNINEDPDRLYPGIDLKFRLAKESQARPEIALGLQSALGHKRMAGEYLALSKRYKDFDFTAGLGWGRYGSAGHFDNPLKSLHRHFGKRRGLDGELPNNAQDWFTGEKIGLFGGVEYFTPIEGLSLKLDYGADRYSAESAAFNFDAPAPFALGMNYQPAPWVDMSVGIQGTEKIMGRISFNTLMSNWRDQNESLVYKTPMRAHRTGRIEPGAMATSAQKEKLILAPISADQHGALAQLSLRPGLSAPIQMGRAAVHMSNYAGPDIEELTLIPRVLGLQGPSVRIMRKDVEKALARKHGSPEEIWHNAQFDTQSKTSFSRMGRGYESLLDMDEYIFTLDNQISLSEEDSGILYRTSFIAEKRAMKFMGLIDGGYALRLNIKDNLNRIGDIRPRSPLPVRSNADLFAKRRVAVERIYSAFTHSFKPDLHLSLIGGYLEEMYAGFGGEVLYRPFGSRFAVGAEAWQAFKRDPDTALNLGLNGDHILSAHVNAWYDIPNHDLTFKASLGRYLAEDLGGTFSLQKNFKNGAKLEGFLTLSDSADYDLFGGVTHAYHGVRLSLPLGGFKHVPRSASAKLRVEPFGRDIGQSIETPLPLYELTEPFSYDHLAQNWDQIVPRHK